MDSGHLEYLELQHGQSVIEVDVDGVLVDSFGDAHCAYIGFQNGGTNHFLVHEGWCAGEHYMELL